MMAVKVAVVFLCYGDVGRVLRDRCGAGAPV